MTLKNKLLRYAYLIPWYSYGSVLPIHTKKYKHPMYDVTMTSSFSNLPKLPIYSEIKAKLIFSPKNSKFRNFTGFFCFDDLLIPILQYANAYFSHILRFWILLTLLVEKSLLCCVFCNITSSFLLILTTLFKSNSKRRRQLISYTLCKWKMHFSTFDAFSLNLLIFNIDFFFFFCVKFKQN